ncbi:hypothetical protein GYB61_07405 [bacterium]|nr:hypothetical protein [bacterium]
MAWRLLPAARSRLYAQIGKLIASLLSAAVLAACEPAGIDIPQDTLSASYAPAHAAYVVSASLTPPKDGWTRPTSIDVEHFRADPTRQSIWYRFQVPRSAQADGLTGIYLWRVNVNAALWWNGQFIGSGGRMQHPPARNWNRPLYATIPESLWRSDTNDLLVHVVGYPGLTWFSPPVLGADSKLRPVYERRYFFQITVPQSLALLMAVLTISAFAMWLLRRRDREYLWFGISAACLLIFQSYIFVRDMPFDGVWWQMLAHWCADAWVLAASAYFYASLGLRVPWRWFMAAAYLLAIAAVYVVLPTHHLAWTTPTTHVLSCLISAAVGVHMLWLAVKLRMARPALFAAAMAIILATGVHDVMLLFSVQETDWASRYFLFQYAGAVSTILLAAHLVWAFTQALNETEHLNADLERRIEAKRRELKLSFQREQTLHVERALLDERERIYADLHDDVGAKLLSLIYSTEGTQSAYLARSAMEDLRDTVSRASHGSVPLQDALADWQAECAERVSHLDNVYLDWDTPSITPTLEIDPHTRIALGRVLREAMSNALRHAKPNEIECRFTLQPGEFCLRMSHDGTIGDVAAWKPGRGMQTMKLRLQRLGGTITWRQDGAYATIEWRIPRQAQRAGAL